MSEQLRGKAASEREPLWSISSAAPVPSSAAPPLAWSVVGFIRGTTEAGADRPRGGPGIGSGCHAEAG